MIPDGLFYTVSTWALPVLLAVTLHEAAHGWVAMKLGDPTAKVPGSGHVLIRSSTLIPWGTAIVIPAGLLMLGVRRAVPVRIRQTGAGELL